MEAKVIGNKIIKARKDRNLSQAQLAERLFISPQAVGKWERGESVPDIIVFTRLAEVLGVDLNYFSESFESKVDETSLVTSLTKHRGSANETGTKLKWDMSRGNWVDADFSGLKDLHEKFSSSNMQRCKFIGSDLSGLLLEGNNVDSCDFSKSSINGCRIKGSNLANNLFNECSMQETEFTGSHIYGCDFSGANLRGMSIKSGGFEKNKLVNAIWNGTSFIETYLSNLIFDGVVSNCYFENCTFKTVTFVNAILTNTFFKNKTLKHIRFVDCQADRMTYEFLKNGNAVLSGVTLMTP
jgi:uncharacterized protein YjbI with pentapeptide repeats